MRTSLFYAIALYATSIRAVTHNFVSDQHGTLLYGSEIVDALAFTDVTIVAPGYRLITVDTRTPPCNASEWGAPHAACAHSGPGFGDGGVPNSVCANCDERGLALRIAPLELEESECALVNDTQVVQVQLTFTEPATIISIGLLNTLSSVRGSGWRAYSDEGETRQIGAGKIPITCYGDGANGYQSLAIGHILQHVRVLHLYIHPETLITSVDSVPSQFYVEPQTIEYEGYRHTLCDVVLECTENCTLTSECVDKRCCV